MFSKLAAGASVIPLTVLMLAGYVSQSSYDELQGTSGAEPSFVHVRIQEFHIGAAA